MIFSKARPHTHTAIVVLLAALIVGVEFLWQGTSGFSLWDEGFLWYGVQRVLRGEVPIRDFMAYEPGRYYSLAAFVALFPSPGIVPLRAGLALAQLVGLVCAIKLIDRSKIGAARYPLVVAALTIAVWMLPRHKMFDVSIAIIAVSVLTSFVSSPNRRTIFLLGIACGLISLFGRNHALYFCVSTLLAVGYVGRVGAHRFRLVDLGVWGLGVGIGVAPLGIAALSVPHFADSIIQSVRLMVDAKSTNLPLPLPWPWLFSRAELSSLDGWQRFVFATFFCGVLAFACASTAWILHRVRSSLAVPAPLLASTFVALPYTHFAVSRADIGHLAQAIAPALLGAMVVLIGCGRWVRYISMGALLGASCFVCFPQHPGWVRFRAANWVPAQVLTDTVYVDPSTANELALLSALEKKYLTSPNDTFLAVPYWPGAYAYLDRKAPSWEFYPLFPRTPAFQREELVRIEQAKPRFALLIDAPLDGREELRYRNTHPLIAEYLRSQMQELSDPALGTTLHLFVPKEDLR